MARPWSNCTTTRSAPASGCSWSMTCWPPAARRRRASGLSNAWAVKSPAAPASSICPTLAATRASPRWAWRCTRSAPTTASEPPNLTDQLESRHIHQPPVSDLERRDHRQRQKRQLQERLLQRNPERFCRRAQFFQPVVYLLEGRKAHQSGHRQRQFGQHPALMRHDKAALDLRQPVHGKGHVVILHPHAGDIVVIVTDGRGDGPTLQSETTPETRGDIAVAPVPLDHRDTYQIAGGIRALVAVLWCDLLVQMLGQDLALENADHVGLGAVAGVTEILRRHRPRLDRMAAHRRHAPARGKRRVIRHHAAA